MRVMRFGLVLKLILIFGAFAALGFWYSTQNIPVVEKPIAKSSDISSYGGEHVVEVIPTTEVTTPVITPEKESVVVIPVSDITKGDLLLRQTFATRYNKPVEAVSVSVEKRNGNYVKGSVDFDASGYGAAFFAIQNTSTEWNIVAVENGVIACTTIDPYSFPSDIIPQCYSYATGTVVNR